LLIRPFTRITRRWLPPRGREEKGKKEKQSAPWVFFLEFFTRPGCVPWKKKRGRGKSRNTERHGPSLSFASAAQQASERENKREGGEKKKNQSLSMAGIT